MQPICRLLAIILSRVLAHNVLVESKCRHMTQHSPLNPLSCSDVCKRLMWARQYLPCQHIHRQRLQLCLMFHTYHFNQVSVLPASHQCMFADFVCEIAYLTTIRTDRGDAAKNLRTVSLICCHWTNLRVVVLHQTVSSPQCTVCAAAAV